MSDINAILAKLSEYDFIFVGDKSGSMGEDDMPGGATRWAYMQETAIGFARDICKIDTDGIGVIFFGGASITTYENCNVDAVKQAFAENRPSGGTPLAEALTAAFTMAKKGGKKSFIVVFTDGVPNDKQAVKEVIIKQTNSQDTDDQCTILFVQVAKDPSATAYLKTLDDDLTGAKFDIVDTVSQEEAEAFSSTAELVLKAIND